MSLSEEERQIVPYINPTLQLIEKIKAYIAKKKQ